MKGRNYITRACKTSLILSIFFALAPLTVQAAVSGDEVKAMLERECTNLDKAKLFKLIGSRFPDEMVRGVSPDLFKIMEGVVKRTDFDNIKEEKTAEIIEMVYGAFRKGAPLEYLDRIFDVAYAKTVSADRLAAAANALREFSASDVPQDIYEEFVYRSLEDEWDPAATPVLTRGLIYGVERGLTPQRVALVIMLDVHKGELAKKSADRIVLDAIKLVREKEPKNWKPMRAAERDLIAKQGQKKKLEALQKEAEEKKKHKEEEKRKAEEELRRMQVEEARTADDRRRREEQERRAREIQAAITAYQNEIRRHQQDQADLSAEMRKQTEALQREKEARDHEREENRKKQLDAIELDVLRFGQKGRLNMELLLSSVGRYLGTPYRYGGDSEAGIDCSAFTRRVYRDQGVESRFLRSFDRRDNLACRSMHRRQHIRAREQQPGSRQELAPGAILSETICEGEPDFRAIKFG